MNKDYHTLSYDLEPGSGEGGTPLVMVALWNRADHYIFALWLLLLMVALCNRADHYILWSPYGIGRPYIFSCCGLFFLLLLLFFPRLISAAAEWMSAILPHMVWP